MSVRSPLIAALVLLPMAAPLFAQGAAAPAAQAGDANPLPVLDAGGPTAAVTALAFSADGRTLYAAGYDKVVRVWRREGDAAAFQSDPRATFRVPIGPGRDGVVNVLAVSADGAWLAVSGLGVYRGSSGFGQPGWIAPADALTAEMRRERNAVYLFNTRSNAVAVLRGHEEDVLALAFVPSRQPADAPLLVSVARTGKSAGRVCVWDVGRATAVNEQGEPAGGDPRIYDWAISGIGPVPGEPPPGLAVRRAAGGGCRVAVGWGDGKLRLREVGADGRAAEVDVIDEPRNGDGRAAEYTHAVAVGPGVVLTGGFVNGQGYVQVWDDGGRRPRPMAFSPLAPPGGGSYALPRAIAFVSSVAGGGPDHVAVVLRSPASQGAGQDYRLALLDLKTLRPVGDRPLGAWLTPPVVAASPDGRFLAVTGDRNREVRAFAAGDLLANRPASPPLRGAGAATAGVAFARKGRPGELGLVLRPASAAGPIRSLVPQDLILDAARGRISTDPGRGGWKLDSPADGGWRVDRDAATPTAFHWVGPRARGTARVKLEPTQVVTAFALVPPGDPQAGTPPQTEPLLAVATWDPKVGEPLLTLFRATTGQPLRQLNAHTQPIHSLAATADGRLLASAADDLTVCVWGMTDVAEILGRHAALPGVTFRQDDKSVVVAKVEAGAAAGLAAGDVILSVAFPAPGRKPRPVDTPRDVYEAVWGEKPGETARLQVRRGGAEQTVAVTLEQGTDERKPLVSLFVTRDAPPQWVAWTPLGPYDSGGRDVERYLGWHFNPARFGEPVRFARADAYRERLHKPGLLKPLLAHANLTDALKELDRPAAVPRATFLCSVDGADAAASRHVVVRRPDVNLRLRVSGPSLAKNEVESMTWRVGEGEPRPIPLDAAGDTLAQQLVLAAPGVYRVQVRLRTREAEPQDVTRDLVVRYQPPPPRVRWDGVSETRPVVRDARFRVKAAVETGEAGRQVNVTLRHGAGEPQPKGMAVDDTVTLTPGENVLELRAVNVGALAGFEEFETDRRTVVVVFQPVAAPQVSVTSVEPLAPPGDPVEFVPGRPVTVAAARVRVLGKITATVPLSSARLGDTPLARFRPDAANEFAIDEEITLKPDEQELRFRATAGNSPEAEARLTLVHRPPLPVLTLTEPDPDRSLTEGTDAREVELKGSLAPPDGLPPAALQAFDVTVRVVNDGKPVAQVGDRTDVTVPSTDLKPAGALAAKVRLLPGDNRIEVTVRNRWQTAAAVDRHVFYRQPPRFAGPVQTTPPGEAPFADVAADLESPSDLTRVECNGREYPVGDVVARAGPAAWRVTIPRVSLVPGANTVRLSVSNRDGPCLADGRAEVVFTPPRPKPPPQVEVVNRPRGAVKEARFVGRYAVRSEGSRVTRVELRRDGRVVAAVADPRQEPAGPDRFAAAGELDAVPLVEGANPFQLVAVNGGGEAAVSFTVSHLPTPEWLEIDRPPSPVPEGEFTLTGRVRWSAAANAAEVERKVRRLRVYVNDGFQQQTPAYRPIAGGVPGGAGSGLEFEVRVVLNRPKDNVVEVVCPDLRADAGGRQRFTVDCANPRAEPLTLHLLVVAVSPGKADTDKALALQALKALQARGAGAGGLRSPVFQRVMMHPYAKDQPTQVVSGYVTCEHVRDALESIRARSKPNDVALIYWLGPEAVADDGEAYLLTSESRPGRKLAQSAVGLKELLAFPREAPGACVLLLDTAAKKPPGDPHAGSPPRAVPLPSTRVALLRYGWAARTAPVPGLLRALEEASRTRVATSLLDLARTAGDARKQFEAEPAWEDNLKDLPALANLVLTRTP